jgi:LacI family transcriptional regulator
MIAPRAAMARARRAKFAAHRPRPNKNAMARLPHSSTQKVLLAALATPGETLGGIVRYARERDWHLLTETSVTGRLPRGWKADGVLALLPLPGEWLMEIEGSGVPCVTLGGEERAGNLPHVQSDHGEIGRMAADHLLERAHRSFAWAPFADDAANDERLTAFQARLFEHGCSCRRLPSMHADPGSYGREDWTGYRRALIAELGRLPRPTAIFAFNDCTAAEIVDACRDAGLAIPEEIVVLGVGDSICCTHSPVPLSSIDLDLDENGYRAADVLAGLMNGTQIPPPMIQVPPKAVVTRVSTDVIAVADPRVARALSYVAEHFPDPLLSVSALATAVGMSRRTLERSFREETGSTINEHIIGVRMREASRLLKTHQRAKSAEIAALVGLPGERTFFRTFRRYFGMSTSAHRDWAVRAYSAKRTNGAVFHPLKAALAPPPAPSPRVRSTAA